jgi:type VI secretion system protein ImpF
VKFEPFLLDRLCRTADAFDRGDAARPRHSLEQIKDSVAKDLESLLNTRSAHQPEHMKAWPHAARSVLTFGLMDFVGMSLDNPDHRELICTSIADAIHCHEPRLRQVSVRLDVAKQLGLGLRFAIHAKLVVNPLVEAVSFDALLQPTTQRYAVKSARATLDRAA